MTDRIRAANKFQKILDGRVAVKRCDVRGTTCIAVDRTGKKWKYVAHSEAEADLLAEAVDKRGWVTKEYWTS